jgi:hypothetical protein
MAKEALAALSLKHENADPLGFTRRRQRGRGPSNPAEDHDRAKSGSQNWRGDRCRSVKISRS